MPPERRREVVLVLPPQWVPQNPPFALAALGGHLRSRGIPTRLVDLNLAFYLQTLTTQNLQFHRGLALSRRDYLMQCCQMRLVTKDEGPKAQREAAHLLRLDDVISMRPDPWQDVGARLPLALQTIRGERFYQPQALVDAFKTVDAALELASLPYFPSQLRINDYRNPMVNLTLPSLEKATSDTWTNMFLLFLREKTRDIVAMDPAVVAISINSFSQVLPGLTLARLLREQARGRFHVSLGGNFFGRLTHRLLSLPRFFELFCDSLMVGEGEDALEQLSRDILEGRDSIGSPRTLYLQDGRVAHTALEGDRHTLEDVGFLDFGDLPLKDYLTPEPVVCIQGSRGCYWGRCSFCDSYWGVTLDAKTPSRVLAELRHVRKRYGIRHFEFTDECMKPADMAALAKAIAASGEDIRWFANARTEPDFADVVGDLARGGLTMLLWGYESGSARVLKKIAKGVHFSNRLKVLSAAAAAGVWNFAYIFFGFPGETRDDALATIRTICDHTDIIHSYGRSVFSLGRHSPIAHDPARFGISDVTEEGEDLSVNVSFRSAEGPTEAQVHEYVEMCLEMCREAYGRPLWMVLRNRENLHLYLARYGARHVADWHLEGLGLDEELTRFQK